MLLLISAIINVSSQRTRRFSVDIPSKNDDDLFRSVFYRRVQEHSERAT
jgi:hypothetical protein